jgi:hypothetical protein
VAQPQQVGRSRPHSLVDVIEDAQASFDAAMAQTELIVRDVVVAGHRIRIQFAGSALIPVVEPALGHLGTQHDEHDIPSLTIGVWDAASTGVPRFPLPPGVERHGENGPRYHGERDGIVVHAGDATLSIADATRKTALYYVPEADSVPWYQRAAPFREIVHAWARWHDLELLHAGAVGHLDGGALVAGAAGAGKSTTSVACLRAGLGYAGDDYVLVDVGRAFVHSLYSSAKLDWENLEGHPWLFQPVNARADAKALALLARDAPERMVSGFPLLALLLPTISGRDETRAVPMTAAHALLGLAPSTVLQMPGESQLALGAMTHLVERIPAFRLELGANVAAVANTVDAVITDVRGR